MNLLLSDAVTRLTEGRHSVALVFASRCLLVSLWPIFLLPEIQEVALRTHEFLAVNILFIVALLFSRKGFWIPKLLILGWGGANVFINIFRAESLVRPYAINWF